MPNNVEIKGLRELNIKLDKVAHAVSSNKKLMGQLGAFVSAQIKIRTAEGTDADGLPFKPYSEEYAEFRAEAGRPVNFVDLFFHGSMLSSLVYNAENQRVSLYFLSTQDRNGVNNPEKAFKNQQSRNFFSMSAEDIIDIEKMIKTHIKQQIGA